MEMPTDTERANIPYQADYVAAKITIADRWILSINVHLLPRSFRLSIELQLKTIVYPTRRSINCLCMDYRVTHTHRELYFSGILNALYICARNLIFASSRLSRPVMREKCLKNLIPFGMLL